MQEFKRLGLDSNLPACITQFIHERAERASKSASKRTNLDHLAEHVAEMQQLCSKFGSRIQAIHIAAIIQCAGEVGTQGWTFPDYQTAQEKANTEMKALVVSMLPRLQPFIPTLGPAEASAVLSACGKLKLNPDQVQEGTAERLAKAFLEDRKAATDFSCAGVVIACSQLDISPLNGQLVRFGLYRLSLADLASLSSATLGHIILAMAKRQQWYAHVLVDKICTAFVQKLKDPDTAERPQTQEIADLFSNLSFLRHFPEDSFVQPMLDYFVDLCLLVGQQIDYKRVMGRQSPGKLPIGDIPTSKGIGRVVWACGVLGLDVAPQQSFALVKTFLDLHKPVLPPWNKTVLPPWWYSNTAWSLAALGLLDFETFSELLYKMKPTKRRGKEFSQPSTLFNSVSQRNFGPLRVNVSPLDLAHLYQALDFLQPTVDDDREKHVVWSKLRHRVTSLGSNAPASVAPKVDSWQLCAALTSLGLKFKQDVVLGSQYAQAVCPPRTADQSQLIFLVEASYTTNPPYRYIISVILFFLFL